MSSRAGIIEGMRPSPHKSPRKKIRVGSDDLPIWWHAYFAAVADCGGFKDTAAARVGIHRSTPRKYIEDNPHLRELYEETLKTAVDEGSDSLMAECGRRGGPGFDEPVIYQGRMMWLICPGAGLPGDASGAPAPCPYCAKVLTPRDNSGGEEVWEIPEHPSLDEGGRPIPLTVKRHSDTLLMFSLNARGKGTRNNSYTIDLSKMSTEQLQRLAAGEDPLDVLAGGKS